MTINETVTDVDSKTMAPDDEAYPGKSKLKAQSGAGLVEGHFGPLMARFKRLRLWPWELKPP